MRAIKIKFSDFLKAYEKSRESFLIYSDSVVVKSHIGRCLTRFGPVDRILFKVWKWDMERREEVAKREELEEILRAIQEGNDAHD